MTSERPGISWTSATVLVLAIVGITAALHWPLPLHVRTHHILGTFHGSHVWCFDHMARMLTGAEPLGVTTRRFAFPLGAETRLIGWGPGLLALPLQPLLGPLGAYNTVVLLSPALAGLAALALLRRTFHVHPRIAAGAAMAYALCPFALGSLVNGQVAKFNHWVLPLFLLAFHGVLTRPQRVRTWGLLALATVASSFTSPSLTLFVPPAAGLWALGHVARRKPGFRRILVAGGALALTAASLLPAWSYYGGETDPETSGFEPGANVQSHVLAEPAPVALGDDLLLGHGRREGNPALSNHVTFLTFPLLAIFAVALAVRFPGRWLAVTTAVLGLVLALGPRLAWGGDYVVWEGRFLYLPAALLDRLGYPLREGGMYYRAAALASLGLTVLLAGVCSRLPLRYGAVLAWVLGLASVADGVRATHTLWPRPLAPVAGRTALEAMAADPVPGAVLSLPLRTSRYGNEQHLLAAALHGRPTTALPVTTENGRKPYLRLIDEQLRQAENLDDPEAARAWLHRQGYRYATWQRQPRSQDPAYWHRYRLLGESTSEEGLRYWKLGE